MVKNYSRIKLVTDRFTSEGVFTGMVGYIIESYPDGNFEVEFSKASGETISQIVASPSDFVDFAED